MILYFGMIFRYDILFGSLPGFIIDLYLHAYGVFRLSDVQRISFLYDSN